MSEIINLEQNLTIKKIDKQSINIQFFKNEILSSLVGAFNQNLNQLEKLTGTKIYFRGNSITVKSDNNKNEIITLSILVKTTLNSEFLKLL